MFSGEISNNKKIQKIDRGWAFVCDIIVWLFCLSLEITISVLVIVGTQKQDAGELLDFANTSLFKWHPSLFVVGIMIFMSNGVAMHSIAYFFPINIIRIFHAICGISWFCLGIAGFGIIIRVKYLINDDHFAEVHERIGLVVIVLSFFQILAGLSKFGVELFFSRFFMRWHNAVGTIIYCLGLITVCTGVQILFEVETTDEYGYYTYGPNVQDLSDYAISIYVLTLALGFTIVFYQYVIRCFDMIPRFEPKAEAENDKEDP